MIPLFSCNELCSKSFFLLWTPFDFVSWYSFVGFVVWFLWFLWCSFFWILLHCTESSCFIERKISDGLPVDAGSRWSCCTGECISCQWTWNDTVGGNSPVPSSIAGRPCRSTEPHWIIENVLTLSYFLNASILRNDWLRFVAGGSAIPHKQA